MSNRIYLVRTSDESKTQQITKVSELDNDKGYLEQESDPHVKKSSKSGNILSIEEDGLYVSESGGSGPDMSNYYTKTEVDNKFTNYEPILKHNLTIGDSVFNGSEDVVVPIYNGEYSKI